MSEQPLKKLALIGIGHIGSSIARGVREQRLAQTISVGDNNAAHCARALELGICDSASGDLAAAVRDAEMIVICTPIGTYASIGEAIAAALAPGAIVTDVGSVKQAVVRALKPVLPAHARFVPAHPVAGTENSGPDAGFAALFHNRWSIVTPLPDGDPAAAERVTWLWHRLGSNVVAMDPEHHDMVLAITSHVPHLIAYTIVGTATDLETSLQSEVIKFSAGGFRDFTRIAGSNPIMWRDVFLNNREAVLEMLQRFSEDLSSLQRAIRWGEGDKLEDLFTRTRAIRRSVIDAKQA
jgi:cyclohexadieny/prephenate dehydrogenase